MFFRSILCSFILIAGTAKAQLALSNLAAQPDSKYAPILQAIELAQQTLDVVMYYFHDNDILNALIAAKNRGVSVRVMLNENFAPNNLGFTPNNIQTKAELEAAGISVRYGNPAFTITHEKVFIIDSAFANPSALIMTLNFQPETFSFVRDFSILLTTLPAIMEIQNVFDADWDRLPIVPTQPDLVWSPDYSLNKLLALIDNAQFTLDIYNEKMSDLDIENALIQAARRGVKVRVILSPPLNLNIMGQSYDFNLYDTFYSSPGIEYISTNGVDVRLVPLPYIHAKMILADQGTPFARAFLGSENFAVDSFTTIRELGVLTSDAQIIAQLLLTFNYDWNIIKGY